MKRCEEMLRVEEDWIKEGHESSFLLPGQSPDRSSGICPQPNAITARETGLLLSMAALS